MSDRTKEFLADLIYERISTEKDKLIEQFKSSDKFAPHFYIENLLPEDICLEIYGAFPKDRATWRQMKSFRETKSTRKDLNNVPAILDAITFAFHDAKIIKLVEEITGIEQQFPDPYLYAGGLSMMQKGDFLNPHIDNSHDIERKMYRICNLLYYVTPEWKESNGGNLELWDQKVKKNKVIHSRFNRLVVMKTNRESWHSVSQVIADRPRCCVSNYYFSPNSPHQEEYFHITEFQGRPEEKWKRMIAPIDTGLRYLVRKFKKDGVYTKDVYEKANK